MNLFLFPLQAWGFVGQGSNLQARSSYSIAPPKVIVSRSHSGEVKQFTQKAFGNTSIIEAGGAGEQKLLYRFIFILYTLKKQT